MSGTLDTRAPGPGRRGSTRPDPVRLAVLLAGAWLEVRCGRRPLAQLEPLLAPSVRRRLVTQLLSWPAGTGGRARVRSVRASWPGRHACEATVLVEQDGRVTALAIRLERHHGAWRAVEMMAPEAGLAPLATASLASSRRRDAFDEVEEEWRATGRS